MMTGYGKTLWVEEVLWVEGDEEANVGCVRIERYMELCGIYTKNEVPRQRDYSAPENYPNCALRSQCALPRPSVLLLTTFNLPEF